MGQATLATVRKFSGAWSAIPGYETAVASIEETLTAIGEHTLAQAQAARSGDSAAKSEAYQSLLGLGFVVCSGLKALASANGDRKLFTQVNYSRSTLARGREAQVVGRCQAILDLGTENAEALTGKYNVTAADLKGLKSALQQFAALQPKPRQNRAAVTAATRELVNLFSTLDDLLSHQLDPLMEKFRETHSGFYNEYRSARVVVENAATRDGQATPDVSAPPVSLPKAA
jgi:hypothetical protein